MENIHLQSVFLHHFWIAQVSLALRVLQGSICHPQQGHPIRIIQILRTILSATAVQPGRIHKQVPLHGRKRMMMDSEVRGVAQAVMAVAVQVSMEATVQVRELVFGGGEEPLKQAQAVGVLVRWQMVALGMQTMLIGRQ